MIKKILLFLLIPPLYVFSFAHIAFCDSSSSQQQLDAAKEQFSNLESEKAILTNELSDIDRKIVVTSSQIKETNDSIQEINDTISKVSDELSEAQNDKEQQYQAMKKRIKYLYESGIGDNWVIALLENKDVLEILDNADSVSKLYSYDRQQLQQYQDTVQQVEDLKNQKQAEKEELKSSQNKLTSKEQQLKDLYSQKLQEENDVNSNLSYLQTQIDNYQTIVDEENAEIAKQQEAAKTIAAQVGVQENNYQTQEAYNSAVQEAVAQVGQQINQTSPTNIVSNTGITGNDITSYASQFLGGKYVWGGNSLQTGVDCSGFVQQVYKHFGINTSRTSYDIANDGTSVDSSNMQPGDVIVYDGHVGIYTGGNQMINASTEETGIIYSNINYNKIQTVRRYIP